jgi:cytochrome c-type biogenesis protein CcmH/NrfG
MRRVVATVVVVLVSAAVAVGVGRACGPAPGTAEAPGVATAKDVERLLAAGSIQDAKAVAARRRGEHPLAVAEYLDALIAFAERDFDGAAAAARRSLAAAPDDWRAVSVLYYAELQRHRNAEARAVLDAYLARRPDDERALACLAQFLVEVQTARPDPEGAIAALDRIAALPVRAAPAGDPTAVAPAFLARIRSAAELLRGRFVGATAAAEERVKAAPQDAEAWYQLAVAQRRAGNWHGAVGSLRRAVALAPPDSAGYVDLSGALAMALLEDDAGGPEALPIVEKLLVRRPGDPDTLVLLARSLVRIEGRVDDGIDVYRRLLLRTDLRNDTRRDVLRNCAVALFDWKQGGNDGEYLDEAHRLLAEYVRTGGAIDDRLQDVMRRLDDRARERSEKTKLQERR